MYSSLNDPTMLMQFYTPLAYRIKQETQPVQSRHLPDIIVYYRHRVKQKPDTGFEIAALCSQ
jgi:hypothetical protein